jgi:hypothetical protein
MHNTDNMGKLFVTLFAFLPAGRQVLLHSRQICNSLYRDRASARNKSLCTLTCNLLPINLVPRHSYNSTNFVPGLQKMRHASFIKAGTRLYFYSGFLFQPSFTQQHKRSLLPGR